ANWREAKVIINAKTFLPIAVKLVEPSENAETVHTFGGDLQVNAKANWIKFWEKDPFKPDLRSYKVVQNNKSAAEPSTPQQAPATSKPPTETTATGSTKGRATTNEPIAREPTRSADASKDATKKKANSTRN